MGTAAGELGAQPEDGKGELCERLDVKTRSYLILAALFGSPRLPPNSAELARMSDDAAEGMARMSIKDRMKALEAQSGGAAPGPFAGGGGPQTRGGGGRVARNNAVPSTPPPPASGATPTSSASAAGPGASGGGAGRVWQHTPAAATPATPAATAGAGSGGAVASGGSCRSTGGGKVAALGAALKIPMGPMGGMGGMGGPKPGGSNPSPDPNHPIRPHPHPHPSPNPSPNPSF